MKAATVHPATRSPAPPPRGERVLTGRAVLACFLGFFAVVFTANFFLVRFALSSFGGVETESSYQAGLVFKQEEAAAAEQAARHWQVSAHVEPGTVRIAALDAQGLPLAGLDARVRLHHPTDRRLDETLDPRPGAAGVWVARTDVPPGQWDLVIELSRDGARQFRSTNRILVK
ncbi:FixH family protein [Ancylobacter terrae]|uniref:FixH family protein n=1 Tax=Ancylobacter sp. sgz301288 TaxID=3342077 RepID=UPI00385E11D5